MKNAVKFEEILKTHLQDSDQAAQYLTACFEESPEAFLLGLRDMVEAQGGMSRAAKSSKLNRESLYRLLSRRGNPRLSSLNTVFTPLVLPPSYGEGIHKTMSACMGMKAFPLYPRKVNDTVPFAQAGER